jgi:GAF domain
MRSTGRLAAAADRLRVGVEALERLAAESRLAEKVRAQEAQAPRDADTPREPAVAELEALTAVALTAAEAKDPAAVIRSVEHTLARALDTRVVRVLLAADDPGGLAARVLERQAPLRTSTYAEACSREGVAPSASAPAEPHALFAPLVAGGQAIGVIEVWRRTRPFSAADERLVAMLGGLATLALRVLSPSGR